MHPILLKFGPITLYTYGAMLVLAFSLSTWLAGRILRRLPPELQRLTPGQVVDLSCLALLGGIVGARLFFVALHWQFFLDQPQYLLALWQGGLVWYGGFAGGVGTMWLYARRHRVPFRWVLDLFAPVLALGHAVGRVGCFLNGCCYGEITDAWCGIIMSGELRPVFPVQLAESLGLLFLYIILRLLQRPSRLANRPGQLFGVYLCGYAALRFTLEGYRGDQTVFWAGWTLQQLISIVLLLVGAVLAFRSAR
ncbi:MAG: prolipoprotein diacylglyceryl transferase [Omnitrophica WOR_2 bacterium RIFCSPHIGHO2_02_FULL_68_15]|nr:MAG: prolipoprotein diacylglyceryl transferase [Omnitrophica WOR_2 bacterium RIFCSPHIGHO2_02_FULL_68_15]